MKYLLALFLLGCGTLPNAAVRMPESRFNRLLSVWVQSGQNTGHCEELAGKVHTVIVKSTGDLCSRDVRACQSGRSLIVMRSDVVSYALEAHEVVHLFTRCSIDPKGDPRHILPGLWGRHGVEGRILESYP